MKNPSRSRSTQTHSPTSPQRSRGMSWERLTRLAFLWRLRLLTFWMTPLHKTVRRRPVLRSLFMRLVEACLAKAARLCQRRLSQGRLVPADAKVVRLVATALATTKAYRKQERLAKENGTRRSLRR